LSFLTIIHRRHSTGDTFSLETVFELFAGSADFILIIDHGASFVQTISDSVESLLALAACNPVGFLRLPRRTPFEALLLR
jgi:hypothetical protein